MSPNVNNTVIEKINLQFEEHISILNKILKDKYLIKKITEIIDVIVKCFRNNNKILLFGCGGSAADSQHIAAEFINKFNFERKCLPAIALTTDTSIITAIGNDSDFDNIFSRQVEGIVRENDVVIGISTSGKSQSVIRGLKAARDNKAITIALIGGFDKELKPIADYIISIPSTSTPRIQEAHITIGHIICEGVESELFNGR